MRVSAAERAQADASVIVTFRCPGLASLRAELPLAGLAEGPVPAEAARRAAGEEIEAGRIEAGLALFARADRAHPDQAELLNSWAWTLITLKDRARRDPAKAVLLATRAVDLTHRREAHILDTLGEALFAANRRDEAIAVESEAAALSPRYARRVAGMKASQELVP